MAMNLKEQYEKETGESAMFKICLYNGDVCEFETSEYIEWLENKVIGDNHE